jgi:antitoxin component of RelBE/YafQ-DinJ toxin-antitoxin module
MKAGFIGLRVDSRLKQEAVRVAEYDNISLSDMVELLLRVKVAEFKKQNPKLINGVL